MADKFYTRRNIAERCVAAVRRVVSGYPESFDVVLEPSAGAGAFLALLPEDRREGVDIAPDAPGIREEDFLEDFVPQTRKRYIVVGNPPFGRVSSLAVRFFNRAAEFAEVIAFIVPRTFKRVSVQNALSLDMELVYSEDLPPGREVFDPPMAAKTCFQIWARAARPRARVVLPRADPDFEFVALGPADDRGQPTAPAADIAVRAYGGRCGDVRRGPALADLRPKSWHWLRAAAAPVDEIAAVIAAMDFSVSEDTVRQNSIGRGEFVREYAKAKQSVDSSPRK